MTSEKELIALLILKSIKKGGFYVVNSKGNKRKNLSLIHIYHPILHYNKQNTAVLLHLSDLAMSDNVLLLFPLPEPVLSLIHIWK